VGLCPSTPRELYSRAVRWSKLPWLVFLLLLLECGSQQSGGAAAVAGADGGSEPTAGAAGAAVSTDGDAGSGEFCGNGGRCVYYRENFDTSECAPGWQLQGWWRCGEPEAVLQPPANSPANVIVTWGAGPDGPYLGVASSPAIDLSLAGHPILEFYLAMRAARNLELANGRPFVSGLRVRARVGEEVFELPNVDPIYTGFQMWSESLIYYFAPHRVDLSAFSGKVIHLDFEFVSDYDAGDYVLIDDVSVFDASLVPTAPESLAVPRCSPKATRCAERLAQVCSQSGTWQTAEDCPYICTDGGICGGVCRPYESSCDPAQAGTRLVCEGSGLAKVAQACFAGCVENDCRGVYLDEGFEGPSAPTGWILAGDWRIAEAPGLAPVQLPEDGSSLAGTLTQVQASRTYEANFAQSPQLDLTGATEPVLHFLAYVRTESGKSGFNVWVRPEGERAEFELLMPEYPAYDQTVRGVAAWSGYFPVFQDFQADLTRFSGQRVTVRFAMASDGTNQGGANVSIDRASVKDRALVQLKIELPFPSLFYAVTDEAFSASLRATGGSSRAIWSIVARTDADWVSIDSTTGTLSGVPSSSDAKLASLTVRIEEPDVKANFSELAIEIEVR
jgi:hypothetical protein